jgi:SAM-dependent methyltransferase
LSTRRLFSTITIEGALLSSALLGRLSQAPDGVSGTRPEDYHLVVGRRLRDAINRSWTELQGAWASFEAELAKLPSGDRATTITRERWLLPLFAELGFGRLQRTTALAVEGRSYPISHLWGAVPIHLLGADTDLDRRTRGVPGASGAAPNSMVQELLNRSDDHVWAILTNGCRLRLLRDSSSLTRPAYVEFDLEAMFTGEVFTDFVLFWMLCHESRFESDRPDQCWLERWVAEAREQGVRALDALRSGFEQAITDLGQGFLAQPGNTELRRRLQSGELNVEDYYRQVLRLVYRLVFLLVAEDRDLLHPPGTAAEIRVRYARYYSLGRLRDHARRHRGGRHGDLFESLKLVFSVLGKKGIADLGLPPLGSFLFSTQSCAELDAARLANADLLGAFRHLAYTEEHRVLQRVDFANLGPEELGSVYESLLELHPRVEADAARFELGTFAGSERKTTGSYYTPSSLVSELLDSTLDPLLDDAERAANPRDALLRIKVLDPACGSGHFLIAAAQRIAARLASLETGELNPPPDAVRHALRIAIGHCVYGIDANPMAIELAKVNLWLETVEPGRPLSFLDHHLACGDALLGASAELVAGPIPDDAFKALTDDDRDTATRLRRANAAEARRIGAGQGVLGLGSALEDLVSELAYRAEQVNVMTDETPEQVAAKADAYATFVRSAAATRARLAADAWCAAFLLPKRPGAPAITTQTVISLAEGHVLDSAVLEAIDETRDTFGLLHWHLCFPDVFAEDGGFSAIIGNPPWEKVKLSEKEFFAALAPQIAAAAGARRRALIAQLEREDPDLWQRYRSALRHAEAESLFLRNAGRYPLCGRGDVNTYAVFAEAMRDGLSPRGRLGMIVPTGIATDDTTKAFFADCVKTGRLASLLSFENEEFIFPAVHHAFKFCLLTLTGSSAHIADAEFFFFARRTSELTDPERRFTLSPEDLALLNPNSRTAAVFRSRRDAELTKKIYRRIPVLIRDGDPDGNPWGIEFSTMFHMTGDSHLFCGSSELERASAVLDGNVWRKGTDAWLPLYEGKMVHQFSHRWGDYAMQVTGNADTQLPDIPDDRLADPTYVVQPRYWVPESEVNLRLRKPARWLLGFRDITNATNERTMIATALPLAAVGNVEPLLWTSVDARTTAFLPAILDSFVFDYAVRQKVGGTHLNFFVVEQLPVLPPTILEAPAPWSPAETVADWMAPRVLELTYTANDMSGFGADLHYSGPPFAWNSDRRRQLRAELDAACFLLYGLDRDEVAYAMDTFPIARRNDERRHGEYLTKHMILACYEAMRSSE